MTRSPLLLLLALGYCAAEDAVVAPAPGPAATTTQAPPAPAEEEIVLTPVRRPPVKPPSENLVNGTASFSAGYDSNILQQTPDDLAATDAKGVASSVDLQIGVRVLSTPVGRMSIGGSAGYDAYPSEQSANLLRYGGNLATAFAAGPVDPGAVLSFTRFILDTDAVANATSFNPYVAIVGRRHVGIIGASTQYLEYLQASELSGSILDASYRHWLLWDENVIYRRFEISLRGASFRSLDQANDYFSWTPGVGVLWRFGDDPTWGTVDAALRATYERRHYRDLAETGEEQRVVAVRANADAWITTWMTAGPFVAVTRRTSTLDTSEFERVQIGIKTSATW